MDTSIVVHKVVYTLMVLHVSSLKWWNFRDRSPLMSTEAILQYILVIVSFKYCRMISYDTDIIIVIK